MRDMNKDLLKQGDAVCLPEPVADDTWQGGNDIAYITELNPKTGYITVADLDEEIHVVAADRVELYK